MTVIVTGAAGFIGMHVAERLLARGQAVIGVDVFNAYYDPELKVARASRLNTHPNFRMAHIDVADPERFGGLIADSGATQVVHLAAQAGVRYSIDHPFAYEHSNLAGHLSVLEACRRARHFEHLVYASSSSVYGERPLGKTGFREDEPTGQPVSLYAATKRGGELMSTTYSHLYGLRQSGLRFFTAYGPWGRPDMAYFGFTRKILAGEPIDVFGQGQMARDFTYIDDIVDGVVDVLDRPPDSAQNRILNIGDSRPVGLMDMITILEAAIGLEAIKRFRPMQPGDVSVTFADIDKLHALTGYRPKVRLEDGLPLFVAWYKAFYGGRPSPPWPADAPSLQDDIEA